MKLDFDNGSSIEFFLTRGPDMSDPYDQHYFLVYKISKEGCKTYGRGIKVEDPLTQKAILGVLAYLTESIPETMKLMVPEKEPEKLSCP